MQRQILFLAMLVVLGCAGAMPSVASEYTVGSLKISGVWSRATPDGARVGAGYMTIENTAALPDRLIAARSAISRTVEIHEMQMDGGVMKMRALASGLEIAPKAKVLLQPGGYHIMFIGLKAPIKEGQSFRAMLQFEKAGEIEVVFEVAKVGARKPGGDGHGQGKDHHGKMHGHH